MKIEQIYTGCLAQGAYYIESNGEVAIIDPLREVQPYIDMAKDAGAKIKYILETHFHADFVSGHRDLSNKTGAKIVFGPTEMEMGFDAHIAKDGEILELGNIKIKVLHTPGHTMESVCYLLFDEQGKEHALFSGDTLFIGDVGRPDLAQKIVKDLTQEKLASHLYDSLRNKIIPLPDDIIVYPAHGAGSACGKNMSKETSDTLGNQKKTNYALDLSLSREDFIEQLIDGLMPPPAYFPENVMMNIKGYDSLEEVYDRGLTPLSVEEFEKTANDTGALILDTRKPQDFVKGFIPNSIFIGIDGGFAPWVGTLITDIKQKILIVADPGREKEVVTRLSRVGYDYSIGFLDGGFQAWQKAGKEMDSIESISPAEAADRYTKGEGKILDVRKESENYSERVKDAVNAPLDYINQSMKKVDKDQTYFTHCAGGYRSVIFISILKARGYNNLINIDKGFSGIKESGQFDVTNYVCPSTML